MTTLALLIPKYKQRLERVMREPIVATATKVAVRSPVDTGYFRGNWDSSINGASKSSITAATSSMKIGDTFTYLNDAPYGPALEYEPTHSNQAPHGFNRISCAEFPAEVRKAAKNGS